jgi:superoxide dismutase, Cu-Zn family
MQKISFPRYIGVLLGGVLFIATAALAADATAQLKNAKGESAGEAQLTQTPTGVLIHVEAHGLKAGPHGFHIHQTGKCDAPDFKTAGGHFNASKKQHGFESPKGPHMGDMPNLIAEKDGNAEADVFEPGLHLHGKNPVLDADGAAIVIHAGPDDYKTDPAGDSGARVACGVIQ